MDRAVLPGRHAADEDVVLLAANQQIARTEHVMRAGRFNANQVSDSVVAAHAAIAALVPRAAAEAADGVFVCEQHQTDAKLPQVFLASSDSGRLPDVNRRYDFCCVISHGTGLGLAVVGRLR